MRHNTNGALEEAPVEKSGSLTGTVKQDVPASPGVGISDDGKSVGYTPLPEVLHWFPIRATYHRAQKVYDRIVALGNDALDPYLPTLCSVEYAEEAPDIPIIREEPLDKGLLFVRTTLRDFRALLESPAPIPGLTPYYNHFHINEFGRNSLLTVPDRQMESFKIIVESRNKDIIVRQTEIPEIIEGDTVVVTDGPFAGVQGTVMKYRHQKRVFVQLNGIGIYATAYVPGAWIRKVEE